MAEKKKKEADEGQNGDAGEAETQKVADEAAEQGFIGTTPDPIPNSEYSLESGPDSPTLEEQRKAVAKQKEEE